MTYIYQWYGWPSELEVVCPKCGKLAVLKKPTQVMRIKPRSTKPAQKIITNKCSGDLRCMSCGFSNATIVEWPKDAYFQGVVKGHVLWAWNRNHAIAIRDYLSSSHRNRFNHNYVASLFHLPEVFKIAKNRGQCVKVLNNAISKLSANA